MKLRVEKKFVYVEIIYDGYRDYSFSFWVPCLTFKPKPEPGTPYDSKLLSESLICGLAGIDKAIAERDDYNPWINMIIDPGKEKTANEIKHTLGLDP